MEKNELIEKAREYIQAGLSIMPLRQATPENPDIGKSPAISAWIPLQTTALTEDEMLSLINGNSIRNGDIIPFGEFGGLAIITGKVSGNLEVIDVDVKNDETGKIGDTFITILELDDMISGLLKEIVCVETPGNIKDPITKQYTGEKRPGRHLLYRYETDKPEGNLKLALSNTKQAIIETRGEGGYIAAVPTPGYMILHGSGTIDYITTITKAERDRIHDIARSLTNIQQTAQPASTADKTLQPTPTGTRPGDDYNNRTTPQQLAELFVKNGWTIKKEYNNVYFLLRPDNGIPSTSSHSGYITQHNDLPALFSVWSTSAAPFEPYYEEGTRRGDKRAYTAFSCYALLEHNGNFTAAAKQLSAKGYGDRTDPTKEIQTENMTIYKVDNVTKKKTVICGEGESITKRELAALSGCHILIEAPGAAPQAITPLINLIYTSGRSCFIDDGQDVHNAFRILFQGIIDKYKQREEEADGLSDLDTNELIEDIATAAGSMPSADGEQFIHAWTTAPQLQEIGVTKASIKEAAQRVDKKKKEAAAKEKRDKIIDEATKEPDINKSIGILKAGAQDIARKAGQASIDKITEIITEDHLIQVFSRKPDDIPTGYNFLDGSGAVEIKLAAGALSVIAGRTGHRKTGLCMNIALNVATNPNIKGDVYFLSYEESREVIFTKFLNIYIDQEIGRGTLPHLKKYYETSGQYVSGYDTIQTGRVKFMEKVISPGRLRISEPNMDVTSLCEAIERLKDEAAPSLIIIDYLQLIRKEGADSQTRQSQLFQVCEELRETATRTSIPLLLGAQFNRDVKQEQDIESHNIREAGDIEQTCNLVIGLWDRNFTREKKETTSSSNGSKKKNDPLHRQRDGNPGKCEPGKLYAEVLKGRDIGAGSHTVLSYHATTGKILNYQIDPGTSPSNPTGNNTPQKNGKTIDKKKGIIEPAKPTPPPAPDTTTYTNDDDLPF